MRPLCTLAFPDTRSASKTATKKKECTNHDTLGSLSAHRHPIRLCGRPAADRPAAVPAVLPGQGAGLPQLQPLPRRHREVRGGDGRESAGARPPAARQVPEASRPRRGARRP